MGIEPDFLQPRENASHLLRLDARLDHGRHAGGELRRLGALFLERFGVDEVEATERMVLVLNAAAHVGPAGLAGVALDHGRRIDCSLSSFSSMVTFRLEHGDVPARH